MKRLIPVALIIAVAVLILATTGGANKHHKAAQPASAAAGRGYPAPGPAAPKSAIELRSTPLGKILVDAKGRTLYLFEADKPNMSNCSGACLSLWPALTSHGQPKADGGGLAAKIGTISATGGKRQVTYNGHPLYYYAGDQNPGDTTGQGLKQFGAEWYVLAATGNKIDNG
jgi:predicted lipoprotein with Yx(FWY)xxD motif